MRSGILAFAALSACLGAGTARAADAPPNAPAASTKPAAARFAGLQQGDSAAETYDLNALGLVHMKTSWSLFSPSEWWRPVRGKYRDTMTYVDFFDAVGRPDLGASQSARNTLSDVLFWGGLVALAGGIGLAVHGGTAQSSAETYAGAGIAGGGLACSLVGGAISGPIVGEDEAASLADRYNGALGAHLRLGGKSALAVPAGGWRTPWGLELRAAF
jgi:hypothetical protein